MEKAVFRALSGLISLVSPGLRVQNGFTFGFFILGTFNRSRKSILSY